MRALGGEVVLHGDSYSDAYAARARARAASSGLTFVHPFDDPDVIAGQGTIAMEILRQHQGPIDAIFVAIGGGGLISGVAAYVKAVRPEIRVDRRADDRLRRDGALGARRQARRSSPTSACSPTAPPSSWSARRPSASRAQLVDDFVVVDTDAVCAAIKDVFEDTRSILEPAGALGVAAIKQYVAARTAARARPASPSPAART